MNQIIFCLILFSIAGAVLMAVYVVAQIKMAKIISEKNGKTEQ